MVLRVMLQQLELLPSSEPEEQPSFRGIVWVPSEGGRLVMAPAHVRARASPGANAGRGARLSTTPRGAAAGDSGGSSRSW